MARSKKTRKVGLIGVRKDPDFKPSENRKNDNPRPKKHKGKPAGNRNNVGDSKRVADKKGNGNKDPRHGSKKPVQLVKTSVVNTPSQRKKYATPAQELAALEADERLSELLDKLDDEQTLSREQQAYVDEKMARHRVLCDLLGIVDEEDEDDTDPYSDLDAIKMDDFKH